MKGRSGLRCPDRHVGTSNQIIKLPSAGKSRHGIGSGRRQTRGYYLTIRALVEQSREMGFLNGVRLGRHK